MSTDMAERTRLNAGDKCPNCKRGVIGVLNSKIHGDNRYRYLGCRACNFQPTPNKLIVPLAFAPARKKHFE